MLELLSNSLLNTVKSSINKSKILPFSVYSSIKEQKLLNVPVIKPLLIMVLAGAKELGQAGEVTCNAGNFIFLSNSPALAIRNIPQAQEYFALLIEFDQQDFIGIEINTVNQSHFGVGITTPILEKCLQQFVEWSLWAPQALWPLRRKEIIQLMCYLGHQDMISRVAAASPKISHRLHTIFTIQLAEEETLANICQQLAMSESTLRRKLKLEGTTIQGIKDQVKLGLGLHLLQTTTDSIAVIAQQCGYHSQSRFTDRFKGRFGLTPSQLRKTKNG